MKFSRHINLSRTFDLGSVAGYLGCQAAATFRGSRPEVPEHVRPDQGIGLESGSAKPLEFLRDYGGPLNLCRKGAVVTRHRAGDRRLRRPLARARFCDHPGTIVTTHWLAGKSRAGFIGERVTAVRRGATHYSRALFQDAWVTLSWLATRESIWASLRHGSLIKGIALLTTRNQRASKGLNSNVLAL